MADALPSAPVQKGSRFRGPAERAQKWTDLSRLLNHSGRRVASAEATRSALINKLLGSVPLSIWYPYTIYRHAHLAHHHEENLTEPEVDPESNYLLRRQWENLPDWQRAIWRARKSFIGRLVVAPPLSIVTQFTGTIREWRRGSQR